MPKLELNATLDDLSEGMIFIQNTLEKNWIRKKPLTQALLICEEAMVRIINNAEPEEKMQIVIRRYIGTASVTISAKGKPYDTNETTVDFSASDMGNGSEEAIRTLLLTAYADKISYSRKGNYNFVKINAGAKERFFALRTVFSSFLAILVALFLYLFVSSESLNEFAVNVLMPIQTLFLNALQLVTAPTVFFCIMMSIARFASFSAPGKISGKIMISYGSTTLLAVAIGAIITRALPVPEVLNGAFGHLHNAENAINMGATPLEMLTQIIPDNVIVPFYNTNALQLLVIAVLFGLALGKSGSYTASLNRMASALENFFQTTVNLVSNTTPFAVFFVTLLLVFYFGVDALMAVGFIAGEVLLGFLAVFSAYLLLLLVFGRLNPIIFVKKFKDNMVSLFLSGSSVSAIPDTMKCCDFKLGISSTVSSFSIPFGAISNLDGNSVYLSIMGLIFAQLCGIPIRGKELVAYLITVVLLSIGSPITPGSAMLALTMLMNQQGTSLVILSLVLAMNPIFEMLLAVCNTVGDVAMTLVVARNTKELDIDMYKRPLPKKRKKARQSK